MSEETPNDIPPEFPNAIGAAVAAVGWQIREINEEAVEAINQGGTRISIGIDGFHKRFGRLEASRWIPAIVEHFQTVMASTESDEDDESLDAQPESVFARLSLPFPQNVPGLAMWSRPLDGTKLNIVLMRACPAGFQYVRQDMVTDSERSGDEWLNIGLDNVRQLTPPGALARIREDSRVLGCNVQDAHDATRALFVEELLPEEAPYGVLVGVPDRDTLLALPVTAKSFNQRDLALLRVITENIHEGSRYRVSNEIFWVRGGDWEECEVEMSESGLKFRPPEGLYAIVERMFPTGRDEENSHQE